jgi:hypothetical protein
VHSFNRYAYANNNPYKYTDPDGRNPIAGAVAGCALTGPACPVGAVVGGVIGATLGVVGVIAYNEITEGTRKLDDLETIHDPDHPENDPEIGELSDEDLKNAIENPKNGDKITVKGNKVYDGNTRINEAKQRGMDGQTEIPVDELPNPPTNEDDPLGGYRDL